METNDLGSKKFNNEQEHNEGFSGENLPEDYNPKPGKLKADLEIDQDGNHSFVQRATSNATQTDHSDNMAEEHNKTVEHKDRNSDVAANRYPNAHPDNHENRGNINLDE
jgi:hypothetical protein